MGSGYLGNTGPNTDLEAGGGPNAPDLHVLSKSERDNESTQSTLREHFESTQRALREHPESTQRTLREHSEGPHRALSKHSEGP